MIPEYAPLPTRTQPPDPTQPLTQLPDPNRNRDGLTLGLAVGAPGWTDHGEATLTPTSTTGDPDKDLRITIDLAVGVLGLLTVGIAWAVKVFRRKIYREPTAEQCALIGTPIGKILARHVPASILNEDLADLIQAGGATGHYLKAGPLLTDIIPDPGLPDMTRGTVNDAVA